MRWTEHVARVGEKEETCELLAIRLEPKRLIEKIIERYVYDIKKDFQALVWRDRAGLIWFVMRTSGGLLWKWEQTSVFPVYGNSLNIGVTAGL